MSANTIEDRFEVKDEGSAAQLGALYDFWTELPYWRMQPFDGVSGDLAVALAAPGEVYVIYLPTGGKASLDLMGRDGPFSARWYDTRTGHWREAFDVNGRGRVDIEFPSGHDWTLLLRK